MLAPVVRNRLIAAVAVVFAIMIGFDVAQGSLLLPLLCTGVVAALVLISLQPLPLVTVLLGGVLVGYFVGNRGFAQFSLGGPFPLFPAEFVLAIGCTALLARSAQQRRTPFARDMLDFAVLLWIVLSSARLFWDVRSFGMMAIRDYALVYYAAFYFLAREAAGDQRSVRFLWGCLLAGAVALLVVHPLFLQFPEAIIRFTTVRGVPLIFFKGDLAGIFMAVGSLLFFVAYDQRRSWWALALSLALAGAAIATNNRASMLALLSATTLLALCGRFRLAVLQAGAGLFAAVVLLFVAHVQGRSWQTTPIYGVYERVVSLADPLGQRTYSAADAADKGDNNRFRVVWWRAVVDETLEGGPVVGLGFGHDLAARFVREYYADATDDFSARSPHNVLLTIFGRTGIVGLAAFLLIIGLVLWRTLRAVRRELDPTAAYWLAAVAILCSACFGVVLEGPMGAVPFWTLLGLANGATSVPAPALVVEEDTSNRAPLLPAGQPGHEVGASHS